MTKPIVTILLLLAATNCGAQHYCPLEIWDLIVEPRLAQPQLIDLLGPPDFFGTFANECYDGLLWQYYDLTADCGGDGTIYNQNFLFGNGRVSYDWVQSVRQVNLFLPLI